jgi:hypothetical protein
MTTALSYIILERPIEMQKTSNSNWNSNLLTASENETSAIFLMRKLSVSLVASICLLTKALLRIMTWARGIARFNPNTKRVKKEEPELEIDKRNMSTIYAAINNAYKISGFLSIAPLADPLSESVKLGLTLKIKDERK